MFHQRSSINFGGDSASQNVRVLRSRSSNFQNENVTQHRNQLKSSAPSSSNNPVMGGKKPLKSLSKTPHGKNTSTRRRAFGDISNKKANNNSSSNNSGFGKESSSSLKRNSQQKDVLKSRSSNLLPRSVRKAPTIQNNTRFTILPEQQPKPFRLEGSLNKAANIRNTIEQNRKSVSTSEVMNHHIKKVLPVPDIERTAGRTWKQQLEYDLKDEDDLASISSIDSLLNLKSCFNPQDMWEEEELRWKHQKEKADQEDRQLKEQMKEMMDREQKEADDELDCLYNTIDNLEIFSNAGDEPMHDDLSEFDLDIPDGLSLIL